MPSSYFFFVVFLHTTNILKSIISCDVFDTISTSLKFSVITFLTEYAEFKQISDLLKIIPK